MIEQGSAEWLAQRLGKVTASRIGDLMARTKTGYGASRANYAAQGVPLTVPADLQRLHPDPAQSRHTERA